VTRIAEFGQLTPLPMRLLYGGITEEVLLRWGFMTLLVWLFRGRYVLAILISSLVFAIGHLPIAFMLFPKPTLVLIAFVIAANSLFGVIAGVLYWKRGLESAIVAHMVTHLVMVAASLTS
jgi:membrane protease YdiL (CAAX protease family)